MTQKLLQQIQELLDPVKPREIRINKNKGTAVVVLQNGREISVDIEGNWQEALKKHVTRFNSKKPINTKDGDKA